MARGSGYEHFCPSAHALEVVGEKWALPIVRDLLLGPRRFSDLLRDLPDITPKWLTARLRDLAAAGVVAREREPGRREVRYRLTPKGQELGPVVATLMAWGVDHAPRPHAPGHPVHPGRAALATAAVMNRRRAHPPRPTTWLLDFGEGATYRLGFDGREWATERVDSDTAADLRVAATAEDWLAFASAPPTERPRRCLALRLDAPPDRAAEFGAIFGLEPTASVALAAAS